jgi:outer membrane lipoprotein SlyB
MDFSDLYSGSAIGGSGTGAATGLSVGGPWGAAIGGVVGGLAGAWANSRRGQGTQAQQQNLDAIAQMLHQQSAANYSRYLAQLDKTLGYFGPAADVWDQLYGQPGKPTMRAKMGI